MVVALLAQGPAGAGLGGGEEAESQRNCSLLQRTLYFSSSFLGKLRTSEAQCLSRRSWETPPSGQRRENLISQGGGSVQKNLLHPPPWDGRTPGALTSHMPGNCGGRWRQTCSSLFQGVGQVRAGSQRGGCTVEQLRAEGFSVWCGSSWANPGIPHPEGFARNMGLVFCL